MANTEKQQEAKKDNGHQLTVRKQPTEVTRGESIPSVWQEPFEVMRDLMRWDPFGDFFGVDPLRLMRRFWASSPERRDRGWYPAFEVRETENAYIVTGDVPGLSADDLDVTVTGDRLQVSGTREQKEQRDQGEYRTYERAYGTFTRAFELPDDVDADKISCKLDSGVLELSLPRKPGAKPEKRKIEIGSGGASNASGEGH